MKNDLRFPQRRQSLCFCLNILSLFFMAFMKTMVAFDSDIRPLPDGSTPASTGNDLP